MKTNDWQKKLTRTTPLDADRRNWFETLNQALASENLVDYWPGTPINYGETVQVRVDDGSKHGRIINVYRSTSGRYERPVTYRC